jgi:hypothetical protein
MTPPAILITRTHDGVTLATAGNVVRPHVASPPCRILEL